MSHVTQSCVLFFARRKLLLPHRSSSLLAGMLYPEKGSSSIDPIQQAALKEQCILVDKNDNSIGCSTKADCHRVDPQTKEVKLHRAFSVFLFNTKGEMLVQKRSNHKITFPGMYTNACCSHPLYDIQMERNECDALGVKIAAQRRLNWELGIPTVQIQPQDFKYLTRIHYFDMGDGIWGEHEIDYILFLQKDVELNPNPNEISEILYVPRNRLDEFVNSFSAPMTPWFQLILKHRLKLWWDNLQDLKPFEQHHQITTFT